MLVVPLLGIILGGNLIDVNVTVLLQAFNLLDLELAGCFAGALDALPLFSVYIVPQTLNTVKPKRRLFADFMQFSRFFQTSVTTY